MDGKDRIIMRVILIVLLCVAWLGLLTFGQVRRTGRDVANYPARHGTPAQTRAEVLGVRQRVERIETLVLQHGVAIRRLERKTGALARQMGVRQ